MSRMHTSHMQSSSWGPLKRLLNNGVGGIHGKVSLWIRVNQKTAQEEEEEERNRERKKKGYVYGNMGGRMDKRLWYSGSSQV